ncbi:MAG TPA: biotin carboxylase N-terminal domain-containing protein [Gaiellaceae bacterium]|nr:biotin carboxylase N-terminal domain-containing protein [Gaiellaceae bacterium]
MIGKLLVANRGEIAVRVFRTCRRLGIATVAVVAPDDTGSLHARSVDEVVEIAGYLRSEEHIRAARSVGADAIHPGYGFLAERSDFAEAVESAGLTWVGPPPEALRRGGDKIEAKRTARKAGVPVLPDGDPRELGFPLLVKAAAGGGGRGMRVVRSQADLDEALAAAEREAAGAFGDGALYCERYLERPRHVEVQLLADAQGGVVAVGERDCSVQRRHQKILEEAPAPRLDTRLRDRMLDAAVAFGQAIGYRGAGTVEFIVDGDEFFFLELNGRIQVEHPVTEAVTGLDLVERQIRIAEGEQLVARSDKAGGCGVEGPAVDGHAIEVRLYAEDPRSFLPQAGRIDRLTFPGNGPLRGEAGRVRVDAGVEEGDEVGIAYDSMIAKLVAHGQNREDALDTLAAALDETEVTGVTTNLSLLRWLVAHPVVRAAEVTTAFLTEHPPLSPNPPVLSPAVWRRPWRLNLPAPPAAPPPDVDVESHRVGATHGESTVVAPMPGTVIRVEVEAGDSVQARSALVVLEAMKMEIPVHSPFDASVTAVHVAPGDRVAGGALLVELEN